MSRTAAITMSKQASLNGTSFQRFRAIVAFRSGCTVPSANNVDGGEGLSCQIGDDAGTPVHREPEHRTGSARTSRKWRCRPGRPSPGRWWCRRTNFSFCMAANCASGSAVNTSAHTASSLLGNGVRFGISSIITCNLALIGTKRGAAYYRPAASRCARPGAEISSSAALLPPASPHPDGHKGCAICRPGGST